MDIFKHYLTSSAITFVATFCSVFAAGLTQIPLDQLANIHNLIVGAVSGAVVTAFRATLKAVVPNY